MGLPLFIAPPSPELAPRIPEKATAIIPRSSIRRQRTRTRPSRATPIPRRHLDSLISESASNSSDYRVWEGETYRAPQLSQLDTAAVTEAAHHRAHRILSERQTRSRENLSFERRNPILPESDSVMPPVPESRDFDTAALARHRRQPGEAWREPFYPNHPSRPRSFRRGPIVRVIGPRVPAPTPPYTESNAEELNDMRALLEASGASREDTERTTENSPLQDGSPEDNSVLDRQRISDYIDLRDATRRRTALAERLQAFRDNDRGREISRRMRARLSAHLGMDGSESQSWIYTNGLGDRERSPEGESTWEPLQSSITPDPQPPSMGSSFASTSASAGVAPSSAMVPSTANTSMTSLVSNEDSRTIPDCDVNMSESSDSSDEDEDESSMYQADETRRAERFMRDNRYYRSYADAVSSEHHQGNSNYIADTDNAGLGGMQRIISALAERDDIPDEWWIGAGLRPVRREPSA